MRALLVLFCGTAAVAACSVRPVTFLGEDGGSLPSPGEDAGEPDGPPSEPTTATITVNHIGAATGHVSAQDLELSCTDSCTATVAVGTVVTLVARPDTGAVFAGWTGGCSSLDATCSVTVTE